MNGIALNAALAAEITPYDAYGAIEDMIVNPARYGLGFVAPTNFCIQAACANDLAVGATWGFWDALHTTTRAQEFIAGDIAALVAVPEPAGLVLLVGGIAGLAATRRRDGGRVASTRA